MVAYHGRRFMLLLFFLAISSGFVIVGCNDNKPAAIAPASGQGFTFLEMGADTLYSRSIRQRLRKTLGAEAVETHTIVSLEINYPGFIASYFEPLHRLNQLLNDARGARVEHDTIKLVYRHPQRKSRLFKSVTLFFSNQSGKPLFFNIVTRKEGVGILETMREKYGDPQTIEWSREPGQSYFWKDQMDFLVVSRVLDRFGDPEYRIAIYYGTNIDQLIESEQDRIQKREDIRKREGQTAF